MRGNEQERMSDIRYLELSTPAAPTMTRDWALCRWLAEEVGVITIPASPFYSLGNRPLAANLARFAFCKGDDKLRAASARLARLGEQDGA